MSDDVHYIQFIKTIDSAYQLYRILQVGEKLSVFRSGERVRITSVDEPNKVYKIKKIKTTRKGGILYLLKSLEKNPILRMYYEDKKLLLERIR
ncbi:protein of unknown function [Nitrosotalea devaniterrae]|uniref:Uncharacterized protein n=1 Tax=Nitrosotalea devaniterrae TaxID=1078905 RepID=A0A128A2K4_9ARCH|nr:protein of unknown function [Candidatus Nitrosotalea devanaterra]